MWPSKYSGTRPYICHTYISLILLVEKKLRCGEISAFHVRQLWGNWKFEILHIWHVCDVENVAIYAKFKSFHVEKNWAQKYNCGEKWQIWGLSGTLNTYLLSYSYVNAENLSVFPHVVFCRNIKIKIDWLLRSSLGGGRSKDYLKIHDNAQRDKVTNSFS